MQHKPIIKPGPHCQRPLGQGRVWRRRLSLLCVCLWGGSFKCKCRGQPRGKSRTPQTVEGGVWRGLKVMGMNMMGNEGRKEGKGAQCCGWLGRPEQGVGAGWALWWQPVQKGVIWSRVVKEVNVFSSWFIYRFRAVQVWKWKARKELCNVGVFGVPCLHLRGNKANSCCCLPSAFH